jgi:type IV pilus assembly protein PilM
MFNKNNSVLIIDVGSKLTMLNAVVNGHIKINALRTINLAPEKNIDEFFVNSVHSFVKENNIKHKNAVIRPSLSSLFIKRLQLSAVPDKELAEAIKWQVKEDVPYDLSKSVFDYSVIKRTTKEDGSKIIDVICMSAKEEEVRRWVLLLKRVGLNCLSVGLLPFSYEKLIQRYIKEAKDKISCVLHVDNDSCYVFIYRENKLDFYRELPVSINKLRESLRGTLVSNLGKIELSPHEIDDVLFRVGIPGDNFIYKDKINATQILGMLRPVLERLVMEVKRSFIYYHSQFQAEKVESILIAGDIILIPNIENFLSKELALNIEKFSLEGKVDIASDIAADSLPIITGYLGLALGYKQQAGLLPYEFRAEKIETVEKTSIRWVTFIVFLLFVISLLLAKTSIKSYEKSLDNKKIHLNVISELTETKSKLDNFNDFATNLKTSEYPLAGMLKKLSNITSRELFIVNFSVDCLSGTGDMKGFVKNGGENPSTVLNKLINEMKKSAYFSEANIVSVEKDVYNETEVTAFDVNFKLSPDR